MLCATYVVVCGLQKVTTFIFVTFGQIKRTGRCLQGYLILSDKVQVVEQPPSATAPYSVFDLFLLTLHLEELAGSLTIHLISAWWYKFYLHKN